MAVDFAEAAPRAASPAIATTHTKTSAGWVLALTSVASFMVALDALVVATALSTIRVDFGASIEALEWTVNAYNLSFAMLLLTGAALGDHFGRRCSVSRPTWRPLPDPGTMSATASLRRDCRARLIKGCSGLTIESGC